MYLLTSVSSNCLLEAPFQRFSSQLCYWTLYKVIVENVLIVQSSSLKKEAFHFGKLNYIADLARLILVPLQYWL